MNKAYGDDVSATEEGDTALVNEGVRITLKNQGVFAPQQSSASFGGSERYSRNKITAERLANYRIVYAAQLDVWEMPIARCEVLKFNSVSGAEAERVEDNLPITNVAPNIAQVPSAPDLDLVMKPICGICGSITTQGTSALNTTCTRCSNMLRRAHCHICDEVVYGLAWPCFACGHIIHSKCFQTWSAELTDNSHRFECPSGCGCDCTQHHELDLSIIDKDDLTKEEKNLKTKQLKSALKRTTRKAPREDDEDAWSRLTNFARYSGGGLSRGLSAAAKQSPVHRRPSLWNFKSR